MSFLELYRCVYLFAFCLFSLEYNWNKLNIDSNKFSQSSFIYDENFIPVQ